MQHVKSNVKYRTTCSPDKLCVLDHVVDGAVNACVHTAVQSFNELLPDTELTSEEEGLLNDREDGDTGTQFIGKGKKRKQCALCDAMQHVS